MSRVSIVMLVALTSSIVAEAYILSRDASTFVNHADIVAVISVSSIQPNIVYKNHDYNCGYTITARVVDSLKGTKVDQRLEFGAADPLNVAQRYLVSLAHISDFAGSEAQFALDEYTNAETDRFYERCYASLPRLKEQWEFTSEFVTANWIPLGYAVNLPPFSKVNSLGVRVSEVKLDYFREEETETIVHRLEDNELPRTLSEILPFELTYPTEFVEWASYRNYLENLIEGNDKVE